MIVIVWRRGGSPVRDAVINKGRKGDRQCPALSFNRGYEAELFRTSNNRTGGDQER